MIVAGSDLTVRMTIYENSAALDLTGATVTLYYNPPDGTIGTWTPTIVDENNGIVSYTIPSASNNKIGEYKVWAHVVKQDLSILITGAQVFYVNKPGTVGV